MGKVGRLLTGHDIVEALDDLGPQDLDDLCREFPLEDRADVEIALLDATGDGCVVGRDGKWEIRS